MLKDTPVFLWGSSNLNCIAAHLWSSGHTIRRAAPQRAFGGANLRAESLGPDFQAYTNTPLFTLLLAELFYLRLYHVYKHQVVPWCFERSNSGFAIPSLLFSTALLACDWVW
jgi:hypothetical protein